MWGIGCATHAPQTEKLLADAVNVKAYPKRHVIPNVEFTDQSDNWCGPATLWMAMHWNQVRVAKDELVQQVHTPAMKGSLPSDLIGASRRHGLLAIAVSSMSALIKEISADNPVIIFQNMTVSWAPQWHYALVVGFDLTAKKIILHTGFSAYESMDIKEFERSWSLADYWGLVVLSPNKMAWTANEIEYAKAAVGLETMQKMNEAEIAYHSMLQRWPESLVALIGLGNLEYKKGKRSEAIRWFSRAVKFHPNSLIAKNNLQAAKQN